MTPKKVLAIINPASGQQDSEDTVEKVRSFFSAKDISVDVRETEGEGDALKWAQEAKDVDLVLVSGGDGTVMETMSGLIKREDSVPLAQLPQGTANLLARALGVPIEIDEALELAVSGETVTFDVGYLPEHDRYFAIVAGAGWDANLIADATREVKDRLGFLAYILTGIKNLFTLKRSRITLSVDGDERSFRAHTVMLFNVGEISGTGIKIGDNISPHDGQLNLAVAAPRTLGGIIRLVFRLVTGDFKNYRDLQYVEARTIKVEAEPPLKVQLDGEVLGETPFRAEVVPEGVALVVPKAYVEEHVRKPKKVEA